MRLKYPQYYRQVGVRHRNQLMKPHLTPINQLTFPLESVYHFWPDDTVSYGPNPQDPIFSDVGGRIFIEHLHELRHLEGGPRRTVFNARMMENEYRRKNRLFKPLRKDQALTINPKNLLVVNYALLSHLYRYIPSYKAEYFRWKNVARTFWDNVEATHRRFKRHQFVDLHLPDRIPTFEDFKRIERTITQKSLAAFSGPAELNILDLWLWLSDDRELSSLSVLSDDAIDHVNYLIKVKGYFFVINLGKLNEWRKEKDDDQDSGLSASTLQRYFLRLLHGLRDLVGGVTQLDRNEGPAQTKAAPTTSSTPSSDTPASQTDDTETSTAQASTPDESFGLSLLNGLDDDLVLPEPVSDPLVPQPAFDGRESDGPDNSEVSLPNVADQDDPIEVEPVGTEERLTQPIAKKAWELHDIGLMSGKAYQRAIQDAETYKKLKDPYGSGQSLETLLEVSQEDLALPDIPAFPDRDTIPDKSMLHSKLKVMNQQYLRNVMHKDVVSSVLAIQQQGIAVKDYSVETVQDTMNHYEVHTVTLKPVRGRQSTVRFRLPVVDDDGRFISNGVSNRLRLQRVDVPLRKVHPHRVALTSYYNKTFLDRSERVTNNYAKWLTAQITEQGLDQDNDHIGDVRLSNVFDKSLDLPRVYSILASRMSAFKSGDYHFYLDYHSREKHFKETAGFDVSDHETDDLVVVGRYRNVPLLVDHNDVFYVVTEEGTEVAGTIHDVLGLDLGKAPLEVVDMTVANKSLPVGVVLAYRFGLAELIKMVGASVSRFKRGEHIPYTSDEYRIVFQDETLVFSRLDKKAMMVMAGFNRYHQSLKQFSVWDFDRQDVYYRILEDAGLGVRYLREIDALFQAWVDPITRGLLEEMGEPTEFGPLLLRGVELLQTDFSPEEVDGAYMRYRGYERFAGMVYGELARAAKTFNAKAGMGDHAVELNPHAVWQKIVQDPSVSLVEDTNPFANMREQEVMSYRGDGGRGGKSMVERTRKYHKSDLGVVSESTVDSGDVGVVAYLSPDANFTNLRGQTRRFDPKEDGPTKLLSSSTLAAPCAD